LEFPAKEERGVSRVVPAMPAYWVFSFSNSVSPNEVVVAAMVTMEAGAISSF
jgi:hypothetical protein